MRIGMPLYLGTTVDVLGDEVADLERAGLDMVWVPEGYSFDAISQMGWLAARTSTIQIASGVLQLYSRTPTLIAMSAAGVDLMSQGRFNLGLGTSNPQVIEGFHGVPFDAPLGRTRETIEICRAVWKREPLVYNGKYYTIPLPPEQGTGLGKPLKMIGKPLRARIPIYLASIGPKNVALTAELCEGWEPIFYLPEKVKDVWGDPLAEGFALRDPALGTLDIVAGAPLAIGEDVTHLRDMARPNLALYIGGMGARGKNFYNELAVRYGYEKEAKVIQDLYLDGKKDEAAALVPEDLIEKTTLIGPEGYVRERVAAYRESGVTTLNVSPIAQDKAQRVALIEQIKAIAS